MTPLGKAGSKITRNDINPGDSNNSPLIKGGVTGCRTHGGDADYGVSIHADGGNGAIIIDGGDSREIQGVFTSGIIDLGPGDDVISLRGFTGGAIDGGEGDDILRLRADGFGDSFAERFSGLSLRGSVANVENPLLDLSGGKEDELNLSSGVLKSLTSSGADFVRITGDAGLDKVHGQDTLEDSNWRNAGQYVENGVTYTHWTNQSDDDQLNLFIQSNLLD